MKATCKDVRGRAAESAHEGVWRISWMCQRAPETRAHEPRGKPRDVDPRGLGGTQERTVLGSTPTPRGCNDTKV